MKTPTTLLRPILATACLTAALLTSPLFAQTTATTDPVGFITLNIAGTGGTIPAGFTFASLGLMNAINYQGSADSVTTNTLTVTAGPFTASQFNATGSNPAYFLEIVTPTGAASQALGAGTTYDIQSNTATTITLMQSLAAGVVNGAQFRVRQHWTIASVFGATNNKVVDLSTNPPLVVGLGSGSAGTADQILRWNGSGYDIFYYQTAGLGGIGWRKGGAQSVDASSSTLYPEDSIIVKRLQSASLSRVLMGAVKTGQTSVPIVTGSNVIGNV